MNYSKEVQDAIKNSKAIAISIKSNSIRPEHLFLALINDEDCEAYQLLRDMNLNIVAIKQTLKDFSITFQLQMGEFESRKNAVIPLDLETERILKNSMDFAKLMGSNEVEAEHVFYSILDNKNNLVTELFKKSTPTFKVLMNRLKHEEEPLDNDEEEEFDMPNDYEDGINDSGSSKEKTNKNSKTKLIDQFGTDITKLAKEGKLDPVVGRANEIKRISQILSRRKKNNPVLVGEPGVGKSAIVEGIAQLIVEGNVPENLLDKKVQSMQHPQHDFYLEPGIPVFAFGKPRF